MKKCIVLAILFFITFNTGYALPNSDSCGVDQLNPNLVDFLGPVSTGGFALSSNNIGDLVQNPLPSSYDVYCLTAGVPDSNDNQCEGVDPFLLSSNFFLTIHNGVEKCTYEIMLDNALNTASASQYIQPIVLPTEVPIFTPLGLVVMIGGLFWFGSRRKIMNIISKLN